MPYHICPWCKAVEFLFEICSCCTSLMVYWKDPYMIAVRDRGESRSVVIYPVRKSKRDSVVVYVQREKVGLVNTGVELMWRYLPYR